VRLTTSHKKKIWVPEQHETKPRMNYLDKFNLGTWNVRSLYMVGALIVVETNLERYRSAITVIQEVRWIGNGNLKSNNFTVFIVVVEDMKKG